MKAGANFQDQNNIIKMANEGKDAKAISAALLIDPKVVRSFMPKKGKDDDK